MLNAATLKGKMALLPDQQTVQVKFLGRTTTVTLNVAGCTRRPVESKEVLFAAQAGLTLPEAQFLLPAENMGGNILKQQDQIIESSGAGQKWTVTRTALELQGTIWRAFVAQQA